MVLLSDARNCLSALHLHPGKFPVFFCFSLWLFVLSAFPLPRPGILSSQGTRAILGTSMAVTARGAPGIKGLVTRDAAAHPTENSLALNVHSAKVRPTSD